MSRFLFPVFLFLAFLSGSDSYCITPGRSSGSDQDTLNDVQTLYNGVVWTNLYYRIREDQFLFSRDLLPGSVSISGKTFRNLNVRYDIYTDEIMIPTNRGLILQLNKEMVDSFFLNYNNRIFNFVNIRNDSTKALRGYVNILFSGKNTLYVKYKKEIELLAVDKKFDLFYQTHRIWFVKDEIQYPLSSVRDLYKLAGEDREQLKAYVKKNRLFVTRRAPESFISPVAYYDTIMK